jgi:NADPH:quinone reductase-like Zn-dependent oxidoreductase
MTMKVAGVRIFGEPLRTLTVPVPVPGPGEVLVRVKAAAVNPADLGMTAGRYRWEQPVRFPLVPGYDVAGTADGQSVVAFTRHKATQRGGYAEFVSLPAALVVPLPPGVPEPAAAALPLAGMTAWQALDLIGEVDTVLVNGPRGAVGGLVTQLARLRGIRTVSTGKADAAVDVVGGAAAVTAFDQVRDGGRYVTVVPSFWVPGGPFTAARGITPRVLSVRYDRDQLTSLVAGLAAGELELPVGHVLPLAEAAQAHRIVGRVPGAPRIAGKVILAP